MNKKSQNNLQFLLIIVLITMAILLVSIFVNIFIYKKDRDFRLNELCEKNQLFFEDFGDYNNYYCCKSIYDNGITCYEIDKANNKYYLKRFTK